MAYYRVEPWGFDVENFRSGVIAQTMANIHRDSKKQPEPFKVTDFMINTEPKRLPEPEPVETLFQKFFGMFRGK